MQMSEEDKKKIEEECEKTKHDAPCAEVLKGVPKKELEPKKAKPGDSAYTDTFVKKEEFVDRKEKLKEWFHKTVKPPKEEPKEDIFDICQKDIPCHLECLYGHKLDEEEEKPEPDVVKGIVYTKGGAVYETIAYALPEDFAWEVSKDEETRPEVPYFEEKKKKKKKKYEIMEFSGPVRIVVVDSEGFCTSYTAKRIYSAFIQLSHLLIGATVMCIYFYTIKFAHHYSSNVHIISCAVAFHYCLPAAILIRNKCDIAGNILSSRHQFLNSLVLKIFAIINIIVGLSVINAWKLHFRKFYTMHSIPGFAAAGFAVTEFILHNLMALLLGHDKGYIVDGYLNFLNIAAMVTSLQSLVYGFLEHRPIRVFFPYKHWYIWICAAAALFALTALFRPIMDCLNHVWYYIKKIAMFLYRLYRPHDPCTPIHDMTDMDSFNPYKKPEIPKKDAEKDTKKKKKESNKQIPTTKDSTKEPIQKESSKKDATQKESGKKEAIKKESGKKEAIKKESGKKDAGKNK